MSLKGSLVQFKKIMAKRWPILIFILIFIAGAFITHRDFGMTWDEQDTYQHGKYYIEHLLGRQPEFFARDLGAQQGENLLVLYNHSYPGFLYALNALLNQEPNINYETFHLLNILISSIIFFFAYELIYRKYKNWKYAILAPIVFLLIPRFIGDLPTNPRDGSFAIFYFVAIAMIYFFRNNKNKSTLIVLGLLFGFVQSLRVVGITIYVVYTLFEILNYIQDPNTSKVKFIKEFIINTITIGFVAGFVNIITSPYLGSNFFVNFINSLMYSKSIINNGGMLIGGKEETISQLGRDYLPRMLLITSPIFLLVGALSSLVVAFKKRLKNKLLNLFLIALGVNLILYFVTKPVIFDGIRHFLFILPVLGMLAIISFIEFLRSSRSQNLRIIIVSLLSVNIGLVLLQYAQLYPYMYIYYNETVGYVGGAYKNYETDYWGASFKESVEWLSNNEIDNDRKYLVATCANAAQSSYYFPSNVQWAKYLHEADYFICYSRNNSHLEADQSKLIHTINRQGIPLNFIYKLK